MADQKINELPTKTAPSTGDKMLMIGTAEEYQIDYDKLASAILDKLATKQYSELDTTAKTVLGALDELNSKSYLLFGGTVIYSNSNLNDDKYKVPGNYYCNNTEVAASLQNAPFSVSFTLKVEQATGSSEYPCQTARNYQTGAKAWREYNPYSKMWTNWIYFSDDATLFSKLIGKNAGGHNSIFRGKNLGTQVTNEQYQAIQAGTFDDLYIGDYWVIGGVNWRIAAFDYYLNCGNTSFAKHHAVIVPDTSLYSHNMNDTNDTTGGYVGSKMYTEGLGQAKTQIQNAFGASHVLSHRLLLTDATTNGYASSGEWKDSIVDLMCETMVYGSMIISPMNNGTNIPYNYRIEKGQLPLFQMAPQYTFNRSGAYWLRDVVSSASFALVGDYGTANGDSASRVGGVRPAFCIG